MHIIVGLFFIALGIWGVFDEWYYVVDFIKGGSCVFLVIIGLVGIMAGVVGPTNKSSREDDDHEPESEPDSESADEQDPDYRPFENGDEEGAFDE